MMFMNLNAKSADTQAVESSKLFLKSTTQNKQKNGDQNVNDFMSAWSKRLVRNDNTISYETENYAVDKKSAIKQAWNSVKNKLKKTFTNTVYTPLTFYEFHMIDHLHKLTALLPFTELAKSISHEPYVPNYLQILAFTRDVVSEQFVSGHLKKDIIKQLDNLVKQVKNTKFSDNKDKQPLYSEMQINILFMILTFKALQKDYNPYARRIIKRIFNQLSAESFLNTMETLRYLQNQRPQIQLMPQLTQQQLTQKSNEIMLNTYSKLKRVGTIPKIQLKKVSQNQRRKVITILISGFLSQDQDKKSQWGSLLNCMPDSQVYGLDWESNQISELVGFMATSVKDLMFTSTTLEDKFKNNPFNPAFDVAQQSGKYLAHLVHQLFPDQFINIIGYSLGTEIIKQFTIKTLELNGGKNLQKIVLLGGVSDIKQYSKALTNCQFPISLTNMYTANDSVLQVLLKKCREGIEPVGLKQLFQLVHHSVDNTDVSDLISGHLAYMTNFGKVAELLELSQQ